MVRAFFGAAVGYLIIGGLVFSGLSGAWVYLGAELIVIPGSYDATLQWTFMTIFWGFLSAIIGGHVSTWLGRSEVCPQVLIAIVLVAGIMSAVPSLQASYSSVDVVLDPADWNIFQAASTLITPNWYNFLLPLVTALGIFIGGRQGLRVED